MKLCNDEVTIMLFINILLRVETRLLIRSRLESFDSVTLFVDLPSHHLLKVPVVPTNLPVALKVGAAVVASPAEVLKLDTHSSSESGPSKGSLPPVPLVPMVLPFLCSNNSQSDIEFPKRHVSSTPHDAMVARWRIRVASQPSSALGSLSPTTSTIEILTAPIQLAPPAIVAPYTNIISPIVAPPRFVDNELFLSDLDRTFMSADFTAYIMAGHVGL
nr:putative reverse transcriptase domain-containing protein [Tanacetum cinerariifolium]